MPPDRMPEEAEAEAEAEVVVAVEDRGRGGGSLVDGLMAVGAAATAAPGVIEAPGASTVLPADASGLPPAFLAAPPWRERLRRRRPEGAKHNNKQAKQT